jgi:hypothetical protein
MRSSLAIDAVAAHHALTTLPETWLDLAHGRISAREAAAAMEGQEPAELVERSTELFMPPSAADEEQRLEALLQAHFPVPARRRVPRWAQAGVVALAAASLVLMVVRRIPPPPFDGGYVLGLSPGYLEERDEPGAAEVGRRYREGQPLELVLRPLASVDAPVSAVAFAVAEGRSTVLRIEPEVNAHGVITIAGTPEALGLSVGRWELVVVVGPPAHLPSAHEEVHDGPEAPYDVQTEVVEIVNAPDPAMP